MLRDQHPHRLAKVVLQLDVEAVAPLEEQLGVGHRVDQRRRRRDVVFDKQTRRVAGRLRLEAPAVLQLLLHRLRCGKILADHDPVGGGDRHLVFPLRLLGLRGQFGRVHIGATRQVFDRVEADHFPDAGVLAAADREVALRAIDIEPAEVAALALRCPLVLAAVEHQPAVLQQGAHIDAVGAEDMVGAEVGLEDKEVAPLPHALGHAPELARAGHAKIDRVLPLRDVGVAPERLAVCAVTGQRQPLVWCVTEDAAVIRLRGGVAHGQRILFSLGKIVFGDAILHAHGLEHVPAGEQHREVGEHIDDIEVFHRRALERHDLLRLHAEVAVLILPEILSGRILRAIVVHEGDARRADVVVADVDHAHRGLEEVAIAVEESRKVGVFVAVEVLPAIGRGEDLRARHIRARAQFGHHVGRRLPPDRGQRRDLVVLPVDLPEHVVHEDFVWLCRVDEAVGEVFAAAKEFLLEGAGLRVPDTEPLRGVGGFRHPELARLVDRDAAGHVDAERIVFALRGPAALLADAADVLSGRIEDRHIHELPGIGHEDHVLEGGDAAGLVELLRDRDRGLAILQHEHLPAADHGERAVGEHGQPLGRGHLPGADHRAGLGIEPPDQVAGTVAGEERLAVAGQARDDVALVVAARGRVDLILAAQLDRPRLLGGHQLDPQCLGKPMAAGGKHGRVIGGQIRGVEVAAPLLLPVEIGADHAPAEFAAVPGEEHAVIESTGCPRRAVVGAPASLAIHGGIRRLA